MAYFANSTEGYRFDEYCSRCRFGEMPCPIAMAQMNYNYEAVGNDVAGKILGELVKDDGTCVMFELEPEWFELKYADGE